VSYFSYISAKKYLSERETGFRCPFIDDHNIDENDWILLLGWNQYVAIFYSQNDVHEVAKALNNGVKQ